MTEVIFGKDCVIYAKQPFYGLRQVVEYLGNTHKVAISNARIQQLENNQVSFTAKNYKKGGAKQLIKRSYQEFIRRFALHILPKGFTRIRHYGILSSGCKKEAKEKIDRQLGKSLCCKKRIG